MTKDWEKFEIDCCNKLNELYGQYATFIHLGGSDSTKPDILVRTNNNKEFYIDAKKLPAHSGQFVVSDIGRAFIYSEQNKIDIVDNPCAAIILNELTINYDYYSKVSTKSIEIDLSHYKRWNEIVEKWTYEKLKLNNVCFIVSNNNSGTDEIILTPIESISDFVFTPIIRKKRSGTKHCPKKYYQIIEKYLTDNYGINISDININNGRLFIPKNVLKPRYCFSIEVGHNTAKDFIVAEDGKEIKMRSTTNNPTVLIEMHLPDDNTLTSISPDDFKKFLINF